MPVVLFTFHSYGTWLPNHPKGFVHKQRGLRATDQYLGALYLANMNEPRIHLDNKSANKILDELHTASKRQEFRLHAVGFESTHIHVLVSWRDERSYEKLRRGIKHSITRRLNRDCKEPKQWLTDGGSSKKVEDEDHFNRLMNRYLPSHGLLFYSERDSLEDS